MHAFSKFAELKTFVHSEFEVCTYLIKAYMGNCQKQLHTNSQRWAHPCMWSWNKDEQAHNNLQNIRHHLEDKWTVRLNDINVPTMHKYSRYYNTFTEPHHMLNKSKRWNVNYFRQNSPCRFACQLYLLPNLQSILVSKSFKWMNSWICIPLALSLVLAPPHLRF